MGTFLMIRKNLRQSTIITEQKTKEVKLIRIGIIIWALIIILYDLSFFTPRVTMEEIKCHGKYNAKRQSTKYRTGDCYHQDSKNPV
jgi:hypothetical protein